jgi:hypothetical protein
LASSGISQAVNGYGSVIAKTSMPGNGEILSAQLRLPSHGTLPLDRFLAPICTVASGIILTTLLLLAWNDRIARQRLGVRRPSAVFPPRG